MLGKAAVAMWWDIPEVVKAEFEDWHSHEHMPERLAIPGFLRGSRWIAVSGEPSYFVIYEADSIDTVTGGAYLERLNDPTPWSKKMMPHHRNMIRSLCSVRARSGAGLSHALATIRFTPVAEAAATAMTWLAEGVMPTLSRRKGLTGAHLLESLPPATSPRTTEQTIRGQDAVADRIMLICAYDVDELQAVLESELAPDRLQGVAPDRVVEVYRLAYCLTAGEQS